MADEDDGAAAARSELHEAFKKLKYPTRLELYDSVPAANCVAYLKLKESDPGLAFALVTDHEIRKTQYEAEIARYEAEIARYEAEIARLNKANESDFNPGPKIVEYMKAAVRSALNGGKLPPVEELRGLFQRMEKCELSLHGGVDKNTKLEGAADSLSVTIKSAIMCRNSPHTSEVISTALNKAYFGDITASTIETVLGKGTPVHEMYNKKASRRGATKRESQASNSGAEPSEISQQPSCSDQKTEGYRPDALLAIGGQGAAAGEDKWCYSQYKEALTQLLKVLVPLWKCRNHEMQYMFCYTVCEGVGRLYFISEQEQAEWPVSISEYHSGTQVVDGCEVVYTQVSKEYNLNSVNGDDRHRCAKACILLGVLLAAQYEANYFGHQTMIEKFDPSRRLKTQLWKYPSHVHKIVTSTNGGDLPVEYQKLQQLYTSQLQIKQSASADTGRSLRHQAHQAEHGRSCLPTIVSIQYQEKKYSIEVKPRGEPVCPADMNPDLTCLLMLHVLLALMYMHNHRMVHRDVRVANIIRHKEQFILIDLEEMKELDKIPGCDEQLRAWGENNEALQDGKFTKVSDLYSVGLMLQGILRTHGILGVQREKDKKAVPEQVQKAWHEATRRKENMTHFVDVLLNKRCRNAEAALDAAASYSLIKKTQNGWTSI